MTNKKVFLCATICLVAATLAALTVGFVYGGRTAVAYAATDFKSVGKAAFLMDYATGTVMYQKNEKDRLPIASMVKIMTAMLTLEAVDRGEASFDDQVTVSEEAASMGGSQVFLDAGAVHRLDELLKTVIVASANDSCVALAEHIAGSVPAFVARMNERAAQLGMTDTSFKNCTGLPAAESYSCAKDVATMFAQLIRYPKYFEYASIWLEDFKHPSGRTTSISNTNKLVRFYTGCDGGKTGFTSEAKFCLAATAMRKDMRVVAVMIGADSSKVRNAAVSAMFDYAFANFGSEVLVKSGDNIPNNVEVLGGKQKELALTVAHDIAIFRAQQQSDEFEVRYELPATVKAPVEAGDIVGKAYVVKNGAVEAEYDVIAAESVQRKTLFDAIKDIGLNW